MRSNSHKLVQTSADPVKLVVLRKVILDRPDVNAREEILKVHMRGKPLAVDVSIADLTKLTPGFARANLENLVNEAAILAARRNLNRIGRAAR